MTTPGGAGHFADFADSTDTVASRPIEVLSFLAYNANAAKRYIQFHDATSISGGDTATFSFPIPAGTSTTPTVLAVSSEWLADKLQFFTGCVYAFSTTATTYTAATDADHDIVIRYRG